MNAMAVVIASAAILILAYVLYGGWLARKWGVDLRRPTPAHEREDGFDYVPAPGHVLFGHHFSSIAGAGAINGPILAAVFGWVPVVLWVVVGGVFFGAVHDFGSLFASIRNKGATLATVVRDNVDETTKKLFCLLAYFVLILVVAAFASIAADSFQVSEAQSAEVNAQNSIAGMAAALFCAVAFVWGVATRGRRIPVAASVGIALLIVCGVVAASVNLPGVLSLSREAWMAAIGVYVLLSCATPVWILLQPRDYLSSFLFVGVLVAAVVGIVAAGAAGVLGDMQIPAFSGFTVNAAAVDVSSGAVLLDENGEVLMNQAAQGGFLFPALFVTVTCGAVSGFNSIVASGTTSKQLDSESQAKPIAFGGMLLESLLAVVALCAVGFVWADYAAGSFSSPTQVFAAGLSGILACIPGLEQSGEIVRTVLVLAASAFVMTALDTATRLARYLFQEFWIPAGQDGQSLEGWRKVLSNKYLASVVTVACGIGLGLAGHSAVWPLFGAANQLLAALAMLAVSSWLANVGKSNKMFFVPMAFLLVVAFSSLLLTMQQRVVALALAFGAGGDALVPGVQLALALVLFVLGVVLALRSARVAFRRRA